MANKFAIVTGASSGIGLELAKLAQADGYDLLVVADTPFVDAAAGLTSGGNVETLEVDLSTFEGVDRLLDAAQANPRSMKVPGRRQDLYHLRARVALQRRDGDRALSEFNAALDARPTPQAALAQAAALGANGFPEQALTHLDHLADVWEPQRWRGMSMMALHQWLLARQGYWEHEIAHLRGVLEEDIRLRGQPPQPSSQ